jgi:hypothetical protein
VDEGIRLVQKIIGIFLHSGLQTDKVLTYIFRRFPHCSSVGLNSVSFLREPELQREKTLF